MEGHGYSWSVKVTIFKRTADDGDYQVERVHQAIAPHDSFNAGIRDATLQALGVVRGQHQGMLGRSEYEFYPQRVGGSLLFLKIYYCSFSTLQLFLHFFLNKYGC